MRVQTTYQCEICGLRYGSPDAALECEGRGVPATVWPVGLVEAGTAEDFYDHRLAFAVQSVEVDGHSQRVTWWACRDTSYGDSLGNQRCGGPGHQEPREWKSEYIDRPPVRRLVTWLVSHGIKPTVLVGGQVVPLPEADIARAVAAPAPVTEDASAAR